MNPLLFALLAGSPQVAPQAPAVQTPAVQTPASSARIAGKKAGLICVDEPQIGSRLGGHRVCRTAEEWRRDKNEVRDDTERAQRLSKLPGQ